jgi:hypothetical protein
MGFFVFIFFALLSYSFDGEAALVEISEALRKFRSPAGGPKRFWLKDAKIQIFVHFLYHYEDYWRYFCFIYWP